MDHAYIEENGLVESYHRGLLDPEEEARFEEHFAGCPQCVEQLELARGFQRGLKTMAAEDLETAQRTRAAVAIGLFAWLARRGRATQWGLALATLLVAAALPMIWMSGGARQQDAERRALQARVAAGEQSRRELAGRLAASEARLAQATTPTAPKPSPAPPRGLAAPLTNTPVFLLSLLRGDEGKPAAIDLARTGDALALAVDVGAGPGAGFSSYRATIRRGGDTVFRQAGLKPNALEALMITFPASFFTPGDYRLKIEGIAADGTASAVGEYGFQVLGKP